MSREPLIQKFVREHQKISWILFFVLLPLVIPSLVFGFALLRDRQLRKKEIKKAKGIFKEKAIYLSELQQSTDHTMLLQTDPIVAKIVYYDDLPVLEIYSTDPRIQARAQARLMSEYFIKFYNDYVKENYSGLVHRPLENPTLVEAEYAKNKLDFSYVNHELTMMTEEFNKAIEQHNVSQPSSNKLPRLNETVLKSLLTINDGLLQFEACSAAVREVCHNQSSSTQLLRNLDWISNSHFSSNALAVMRPTPHTNNPNKPQKVFTITYTPGNITPSAVNDKGLVITLNSLKTRFNTNRSVNKVPQLLLVRQVVENCNDIKEAIDYLNDPAHQPNSAFSLTMMDATGNAGVLEVLPPGAQNSNVFTRFRSLEDGKELKAIAEESQHRIKKSEQKAFQKRQKRLQEKNKSYGKFQHVTNHVENMPSSASNSSMERYRDMYKALGLQISSRQIMKSVNKPNSVQTMLFSNKQGRVKLRLNWANGYSATARRSGTDNPFTKIDLSQRFEEHTATSSASPLRS